MKSSTAGGVALMLLFASLVHAEESSLVGRYTGTFQVQDNYTPNRTIGMTLVIQKASEGKVDASGQLHARGPCHTQFPMVGTLKGNQLQLETVRPEGKDSDCPIVLKLTVDGSKLVGTTGHAREAQRLRLREQHRREFRPGTDIKIPFGPEEQVPYSWETLNAAKRR